MSIKQIASVAGYEHTSSFTRAFERHFRLAPSCYRRTGGPHKNQPRTAKASNADLLVQSSLSVAPHLSRR
jgi:AraC-like DNA-binding protein